MGGITYLMGRSGKMKKKNEDRAIKVAHALDIPLDVLCDVPRTEIVGKGIISIENSRGILDYNENCVKVNTTEGIVKIDGDELFIESITDEGVVIRGTVVRVEFI